MGIYCPPLGLPNDDVTRPLPRVRCGCGFSDKRDYVPFYWWLRTLNLPPPKRPISSAVLAQESQNPEALRAEPAGKPVGMGCDPQACGGELSRRPGARRVPLGLQHPEGVVGPEL